MFKKNVLRWYIAGILAIMMVSSCKKEDIQTPEEVNKTVIYIRAVDKDSSFVESEQILLR